MWRSQGRAPARGFPQGLYRFVAVALELYILTFGIKPLGLLARPPAHITELPDPGLTEPLGHGSEG